MYSNFKIKNVFSVDIFYFQRADHIQRNPQNAVLRQHLCAHRRLDSNLRRVSFVIFGQRTRSEMLFCLDLNQNNIKRTPGTKRAKSPSENPWEVFCR